MSFTGDVIVTRQELARKPASWKKHGTNLRGSWLPAKNMRRTYKEAGFLQKTRNELAGKPASCKKHGTNLRGSQLPAKNMARICGEASFLQKTWHEFAGKPASRKKHGKNLQKSQLPGKSRLLRNSCERKRTTPILGPTGRFLRSLNTDS